MPCFRCCKICGGPIKTAISITAIISRMRSNRYAFFMMISCPHIQFHTFSSYLIVEITFIVLKGQCCQICYAKMSHEGRPYYVRFRGLLCGKLDDAVALCALLGGFDDAQCGYCIGGGYPWGAPPDKMIPPRIPVDRPTTPEPVYRS